MRWKLFGLSRTFKRKSQASCRILEENALTLLFVPLKRRHAWLRPASITGRAKAAQAIRSQNDSRLGVRRRRIPRSGDRKISTAIWTT